jgi:SAM-dependent methyltransferase
MKNPKSGKISYRKRLRKYGVGLKALGWHSKRAAEQRYEQLVSDIDFRGKTVLDVGCGFGDIIPYISGKTSHFEYTGVDLVPEFIGQAKKRYPKYRFIVADYFNRPPDEKFDIVICCGALNSNVKNNLEFRKKAIKSMFEHAKEALVFNMTGKYPQPKTSPKSNVWFAGPIQILKYCLTLSKKVILRNHYHSRDFTIVIFR